MHEIVKLLIGENYCNNYSAPEVLQGVEYGHAADWWSLGVLMHTLLQGSYPFGVATSHTTMQINQYVPPQSLSEPARSLLSKVIMSFCCIKGRHIASYQ